LCKHLIIQFLNIKISNTPPFRPDWKAIVERYFRLVNDESVKFVEGFVPRPRKRGDRDPRLFPILTMDELRCILIYQFIYHNCYHQVRLPSHDSLLIEDKVEPYAADLWKWGIRVRTGSLREIDPLIARIGLLPRAHGQVTERGIIFQGRQYVSEFAQHMNWLAYARARGHWDIDVSFDYRTTNYIYIKVDQGQYVACYLSKNDKAFGDRDLYEIWAYEHDQKIKQTPREQKKRQGLATLNAQIKSITGPAKAQADKAKKGKTKSELRKNFTEKRADELEIEQAKEPFLIVPVGGSELPKSDYPPGYVPLNKKADDLDQFEKEYSNEHKK
jgi:putative transposase